MACDSNGVHEGGARWLLHLFIKHCAAASLNVPITLRSELCRSQKDGTVRTYCEADNYHLETHDADDVIAETDADMMRFTPPSNKSLMEYAEVL